MKEIQFTHLWVDKFGWENTILLGSDFQSVEFLGKTEDNYDVYLCFHDNGTRRICSIEN